MNIYTPVQKYPKNTLHLSEEERDSFDVDKKDQVTNFIREAIEKKCKGANAQPTPNETFKMGVIMEYMLDDGALEDEMFKERFGVNPNLEGHRYRDFVMNYVLSNYENSIKRHDAMSAALKIWGGLHSDL